MRITWGAGEVCFLEVQFPGPHMRPMELEYVEEKPLHISCLMHFDKMGYLLKFENHCFKETEFNVGSQILLRALFYMIYDIGQFHCSQSILQDLKRHNSFRKKALVCS